MGHWSITIHGAGPHHNGAAEDIEKLGEAFTDQLRAAGHAIESSTVTVGLRQGLAKVLEAAESVIFSGSPPASPVPTVAEPLTALELNKDELRIEPTT